MSTNNPNDVLNLISQMGAKDPKMQMLAQLMQQNQENSVPEEDQRGKIKKLVVHIKKQAALIKRLEKSGQKMKQKINYLIENLNYRIQINDTLATAVGACPECWGQDPECAECHGKGQPGTMPIDKASFESIVQPALEVRQKAKKLNHNDQIN